MADQDSLYDMSSDADADPGAEDGDIEDDDGPNKSSTDVTVRKKKQKKRKSRVHDPSSCSDSDTCPVNPNEEATSSLSSQTVTEEAADKPSKTTPSSVNPSDPGAAANANIPAQIQQIQKAIELIGMRTAEATPRTLEEAKVKQYQFWSTQPVPKLTDDIRGENTYIEADKPSEEIRQEPYSLPPGFMWDTLDITDPLILKELYTLLNENYVEDDDNMFRFDYSPEFLKWALQPPGWLSDWHCGVRVTKTGKLVGFISAVPAHIKIYLERRKMVEINFLCVHKKLRAKRVAPVLIREITRRVNVRGLFQAVYTAGVVLPKPVSRCRYWHRSLNPRKLIEVRFSHLSRNMTMQRTIKLYKLPESPRLAGFRPFTPADNGEVYALITKYLERFDLAPIFSEDEFRHWFLPRPGIVDSYINETDGSITDFVSFYTLPSTVMNHPLHKSLKAAYSFYNVATKASWTELMQDALIVAKNMGFDVFNALDLMENKDFLEKLKFGIGDGNLQYYMYNWKCPTMEPHQVGLVLQ